MAGRLRGGPRPRTHPIMLCVRQITTINWSVGLPLISKTSHNPRYGSPGKGI